MNKAARLPEQYREFLHRMKEKEGKLDPELTGLFIRSKCWEKADPA